mgnify:CR=1 FL=1
MSFVPGHPFSSESVDPSYRYNEGEILKEVKKYINSTYSGHYAGEIQAGEFMVSLGVGTQYFTGNVIKYAARYGKKDGYNRKDMMKAIHYAIMSMYANGKDEEKISK